jgi:hypothetical protein
MLAICCLTGCIHRHQRPLAAGLSDDAIDGIQVRRLDGNGLTQGENAQFAVRVWYTLSTSDQALLSLNLIQFRNPLSCASEQDIVGIVQAKAGADSLAKINRGRHTIDFLVTLKAGVVNNTTIKNGAVSFES